MSNITNENTHGDLPDAVIEMIGRSQYLQTATFDAENSYGYNTLAATQNDNPLFWQDEVAEELTSGRILPPTTLSLWMRPHYWEPGADGEQVALQVHFDLKKTFDLPEAVMTDNTIIFFEPVRSGDRISNSQVLKSVSGPKTTKLGSGRFWVIDVEFKNQRSELVGIESYTGFGYRRGTEGAA
ncbi:MAG: MaoC family dehydratase N-terminal domain-containing protein [Microthrixaceae bacterium]